jgi:hypothetical protein
MRFLKDGPAIPDDLLIARDESRVVFFCGAGVSRARAGLPDFFGLAERVIHKLGVASDDPACKILCEAKNIADKTGVAGVVSADRIFGLLERDFVPRDIEAAVAEVLRPEKDVDLSAHRIMLDLATTQEGKVRLVTTNFDRLFEGCRDNLRTRQPPSLPDASRQVELDGVIYLHGRVTEDYTGADGEGFILSSSEFGRAYLSDGWATQFFRGILERYIVVFVGYGADDPPVHYLLEALNRKVGGLARIYAFESGRTTDADVKWLHKGVQPIPYDESDNHRVLWETLSAWAERAKAVEHWYNSVIDLAKKGPEQLEPHERGQVAHIVSTVEGIRMFLQGDDPPPPEWLCVFDRHRRYAKPERAPGSGQGSPSVDPFDLYGLDSDEVPKRINPDDYFEKREVPPNAWDAFMPNKRDTQNVRASSVPAIRGQYSASVPGLPSRLAEIGAWIAKVADQATTLWWAASQRGLHPYLQNRIEWELQRPQKNVKRVMRQAWRYLFHAWKHNQGDARHQWFDLQRVVKRDGWSNEMVWRFAAIVRPRLKVEPDYRGRPKPNECLDDVGVTDMLSLSVEYPHVADTVDIPDGWLALAVRLLRGNLEYALHLETELGRRYELNHISPIIPDDEVSGDCYERAHGLSGSVLSFSSLFDRLAKFSMMAAKNEMLAWPADDGTVFARLRIAASRNRELVSPEAFGEIIMGLSDEAFWSSRHQRDLLLVLAKRWSGLSEETRKRIEIRLIQGRKKWDGEDDAEYEEHKAWSSLNRVHWLAKRGCAFTFDLAAETAKLQSRATEWKPEYANSAAESMEGRVGAVRTDKEHSALLNEPVGSILSKARELSGRTQDFLVEADPFAGLVETRPVRAFRALTHAAKRGEYPEWAWKTFLYAMARKSDRPRLSVLIAERVSRYPDHAVAAFMHPASDWLRSIGKSLSEAFPQSFDRIVSKLLDVLRSDRSCGRSGIVRGNREPDWVTEAINAPVGRIMQALFDDPRVKNLKATGGFPADWLAFLNSLLSLDGDHRRYALVMCAHGLIWFHAIDAAWTEANILSVWDKGDELDQSAIWSGFLWAARVPDLDLYRRLKPALLEFAKKRSLSRREYGRILAGMILAGWGLTQEDTAERWVSDNEMRDVLLHADEEFRLDLLSELERWSKETEDGAGEKWREMLPVFLRDVWPRQRSVKTPGVSARLCELALSHADGFSEMVEIIIPLLTTTDSDYLQIELNDFTVVDAYPKQILALLYTTLPDDAWLWAYSTGAVLKRIGEVDETLKQDERLLELKGKWNSR